MSFLLWNYKHFEILLELFFSRNASIKIFQYLRQENHSFDSIEEYSFMMKDFHRCRNVYATHE